MEIGPGLSQLEFVVKCNYNFFFLNLEGTNFAEPELNQKQENRRQKRRQAFSDFP